MNVNKNFYFKVFLRLFRFRLTIRNVNKVDYILGLMADFSFRLTIRNVNVVILVVDKSIDSVLD